jgi:hypothetical protein
MAQKLAAGLPPDYQLGANFTIRLAALDPTTGAAVAGVVVSNVAIMAEPVPVDLNEGTVEALPPLFVPIDDQQAAA